MDAIKEIKNIILNMEDKELLEVAEGVVAGLYEGFCREMNEDFYEKVEKIEDLLKQI